MPKDNKPSSKHTLSPSESIVDFETVVIPVSTSPVNKPYSPETISAIREYVQCNFKNAYLIYGDTLQRYTKQIENEDILEEEARTLAIEQAQSFVRATKDCISNKYPNDEIHYWDNWIAQKEFQESIFSTVFVKKIHDKCCIWLESEIEKDCVFENNIQLAATKFVSSFGISKLNQRNVSKKIDITKAIEKSAAYIKEECSVFLVWAILLGSTFLYRTHNTPLHDGLIKNLNTILNNENENIHGILNNIQIDIEETIKNKEKDLTKGEVENLTLFKNRIESRKNKKNFFIQFVSFTLSLKKENKQKSYKNDDKEKFPSFFDTKSNSQNNTPVLFGKRTCSFQELAINLFFRNPDITPEDKTKALIEILNIGNQEFGQDMTNNGKVYENQPEEKQPVFDTNLFDSQDSMKRKF